MPDDLRCLGTAMGTKQMRHVYYRYRNAARCQQATSMLGMSLLLNRMAQRNLLVFLSRELPDCVFLFGFSRQVPAKGATQTMRPSDLSQALRGKHAQEGQEQDELRFHRGPAKRGGRLGLAATCRLGFQPPKTRPDCQAMGAMCVLSNA